MDILIISFYDKYSYEFNFFNNINNLDYNYLIISLSNKHPLSNLLNFYLNKYHFDDIILFTSTKNFMIENKNELLNKYLSLEKSIGRKVIIICEDKFNDKHKLKDNLDNIVILSRVKELSVFLNREEIISNEIYFDKGFFGCNYKDFIEDSSSPSMIIFDNNKNYQKIGKLILEDKFIKIKKHKINKKCNIL